MINKQYKDRMNKIEQGCKRSVDFVIAACCLVVFSPLALACALAIRKEDGLPVIYKQERIGLHGKPFYIYKFRSMRIDAEKDGPDLLEIKGDPRLTKVGRFLRAHHLDELPQLWNVFKGDMSFIGPRPERKFYIDQIMGTIHDTSSCIRFDLELHRMPHCIMAIRIRWRRCCDVWNSTFTIWSIGRGGLTPRYC